MNWVFMPYVITMLNIRRKTTGSTKVVLQPPCDVLRRKKGSIDGYKLPQAIYNLARISPHLNQRKILNIPVGHI